MVSFKPVIKWTGSKRPQASDIIKYFPQKMKTYYEPFCGGASMMRHLLDMRRIVNVENIECSDLNNDLISLWNTIKTQPDELSTYYEKLWKEMYAIPDRQDKRTYYTEVRKRFNEERNPFDFMFILRTTTNGMPRYSSDNKFNNSFHITRDGIKPDSLAKIISEWSYILNEHNVQFFHRSYSDITPDESDFMYMDPPYHNTGNKMYLGGFDANAFFGYMDGLKCPYVLSYDGKAGEQDFTYAVPYRLYDKHIYIKSGNSSFRRTIGKDNASIVYESLYVKNVGLDVQSYMNPPLF